MTFLRIWEVMVVHLERMFGRLVFRSFVSVVANQLFLLGIHGDHWQTLRQEFFGAVVDKLKLLVSVRTCFAGFGYTFGSAEG